MGSLGALKLRGPDRSVFTGRDFKGDFKPSSDHHHDQRELGVLGFCPLGHLTVATLSESGQSWQVSVPRPPAAGGLQEPDLGHKKENRFLW